MFDKGVGELGTNNYKSVNNLIVNIVIMPFPIYCLERYRLYF